jgi:choloylglycine hydrolase
MKKSVVGFTFIATCIIGMSSAQACTDFRLQAKDGNVLITRSMEFGANIMHSNLRTSNRERAFDMQTDDGKPAINWKAKYGYIYMDGMNQDKAIDGMNEAGLSFEALFFPGYAEYQKVPAGHEKQALPYISIGDWILGNFKTIDEVRQALANIYLINQKLPGEGDMIFPLHFSIYDASGKGIIVEYVAGKMAIHDSIGIFTNSPAYSWHLENLQNYLHLAPINPTPTVLSGTTFAANGQGYGMIGLPGDISPPSRFVKTAALVKVTSPADNAAANLTLAQHIINNVDIPFGLAREAASGQMSSEQTDWVVFKDLTNKIFYYRTYDNMTINMVQLSKIDFTANSPRLKMPIANGPQPLDFTDKFLQTKATSD